MSGPGANAHHGLACYIRAAKRRGRRTHSRHAFFMRNQTAYHVQDLDVDVRLALPALAHAALLAQIAIDTELLQALHVMDYSLLLGLHLPRWGSAWFPPHSAPVRAHLRSMSCGGAHVQVQGPEAYAT